MKKTVKKKSNKLSADDISNMADQGKSISKFFTNTGSMKKPIQKVNVDFVGDMLEELDRIAVELSSDLIQEKFYIPPPGSTKYLIKKPPSGGFFYAHESTSLN